MTEDNVLRETQQESNERTNKLISPSITGKCPHCKESLGNNYYILEICPFCRLELHE